MKHIIRITAALLIAVLMLGGMLSCAKAEAFDRDIDAAYNEMSDSSFVADDTISEKPTAVGSMPTGGMTEDSATAADEFASKIIKTVYMDTETRDFDGATAALDRLITENGGFIESMSTNGQSLYASDTYRRSAKYTIRIPAERLSDFLAASEQLLNVTHSNTASQNVTTEYYDIQSRLEVLRSERDALDAMLDKADTVENMLIIRDRLYNVIEEIEAYETRLRLLDSLVSYSTVHLNVDEVKEYTEVRVEQPTWGERLGEAFTESWRDFAHGFQNFTVWLLYAIPTLLVIGAVLAGVLAVLLTVLRRRAKRAREQRDTDQK